MLSVMVCCLAACNSKPANTATAAPDSIAKQPDTYAQPERVAFLEDPFKDINRFDIAVGNDFIDSVYQAYATGTDTTSERDLCLGDACTSYLTIENSNENTTLYMAKTNCYEYGFGNDQFLLKNDSLYFTRRFNVNVEEYPTAQTDTKWRIEETVHWFNGDSVTRYIRTTFTRKLDGFDFTLKNVTPVLTPADTSAYANDVEHLKQILTLKEKIAAD